MRCIVDLVWNEPYVVLLILDLTCFCLTISNRNDNKIEMIISRTFNHYYIIVVLFIIKISQNVQRYCGYITKAEWYESNITWLKTVICQSCLHKVVHACNTQLWIIYITHRLNIQSTQLGLDTVHQDYKKCDIAIIVETLQWKWFLLKLRIKPFTFSFVLSVLLLYLNSL